jgi:protein MpaA
VIGYSREGRPLVAYHVGARQAFVLVIGGIHAGTEANTAALVEQLLDAFRFAPPDLTVTFLPVANPDGLTNGTRLLTSGVDPNRNWPTDDWSPDTYEAGLSGPIHVSGGGGPYPLSEPETLALANFVLRVRPGAIISYHSAADLVMAGPAARARNLDLVYGMTAGYPVGDWTAYPVTGDFAQWAEHQAIPTIEVELRDHTNTDLEANLAAVKAVVRIVAASELYSASP